MTLINDYLELRIYLASPGRIHDLHHRMGYEVPKLFARHGIPEPLGYWQGFAGAYAPTYAYILPWKSLDDRAAAFDKFYADPDWQAHRDDSNVGDHMIETMDVMIMRPSPMWNPPEDTAPQPIGGLHELRMIPLSTRDAQESQRALAEIDIPFLQERGAKPLGLFTVWYGSKIPQAVMMLAWDNFEQREAAVLAHQADPAIAAQRKQERETHGGPLFMASENMLLEPADYGLPKSDLSPRR